MTERPQPRPSLTRGTQVAGYVVEERIGVGGFGEVFRARQPLIGREVAIKVLHAQYSNDPDAVARFVAEARAVNQISHAGIVEIFDFGRLEDGREFCIMELLVGRTLRDLLRERGRLPLAEALPILRGIAEAVDAAHAAGIAHRDLKPDNVFVLADGRTKLIDFGLAKLTREHDSPVTQTGSVFGTPLYMSPEQCRGGSLDTRTDLYSFGVVAYHVLVGEPPFSGDPIELALHHVNDRAEAPSRRCEGLPRYVDHVLLSLLAKDPVDRPPSLATAVAALEGSITLRRMRARHVRQLAVTAVVIGALAFGAFELATRSHAEGSCAPASERLHGIWDPTVRATIAARFADSPPPGKAASWRVDQARLDASTAAWSAQWDAACHEDATDQLRHVQRVTCLDNMLLGIDGAIQTIAAIDLTRYSEMGHAFVSYDGRSLADCANPAVLRAQLAAPSPAIRDEVTALLLESYRASADADYGAYDREAWTVDTKVDRLDAIARRLEAIYPEAAGEPILARAGVLVDVTWDVAARLPRARAAMADAIRRIQATHDDVMLAEAYLLDADFEIEQERDGDAIARGEVALELAAQAITRAGGPRQPTMHLALTRGMLALHRGEPAAASAAIRAAIDADPEDVSAHTRDHLIATTLALAGRDAEAREAARRGVVDAAAQFGDVHSHTGTAKYLLARVLEVAGDLEGAVALQRQVRAIADQLDPPPAYSLVWTKAWETDLAVQVGRSSDAAVLAAVHALADRGTTPTKQSGDGLATARRAGHFAAFARAAELDAATGSDQALESAAILAFARGDDAAMATYASQVAAHCATGCADWIRTSRWLAILAEAKAHPTTKIDERLAALEREYGGDRTAMATTGAVLASLGRWDDALVKLEAARAIPNVWERQADLVEVDTWLGLARLHHGDVAGARPAFEEALDAISIWRNGFDGFTYMTPVAEVALARILPDADRLRARWLATRASAGFARLGPHRDAERAEAASWLAGHPPITPRSGP